jgi:hypothetical protein
MGKRSSEGMATTGASQRRRAGGRASALRASWRKITPQMILLSQDQADVSRVTEHQQHSGALLSCLWHGCDGEWR